jgi:hypothetical protein
MNTNYHTDPNSTHEHELINTLKVCPSYLHPVLERPINCVKIQLDESCIYDRYNVYRVLYDSHRQIN